MSCVKSDEETKVSSEILFRNKIAYVATLFNVPVPECEHGGHLGGGERVVDCVLQSGGSLLDTKFNWKFN